MIKVTIKPESKRVLIEIPQQLKKHRYALEKALWDIGIEVTRETAKIIRTGRRTGRVYKYKRRNLRASAPGEPPRNRSGRLARSGDFKVRNWAEMTVGQTVDYAEWLADGTRNMEPRPSMIQAIKNKARDTERIILESVQRELND